MQIFKCKRIPCKVILSTSCWMFLWRLEYQLIHFQQIYIPKRFKHYLLKPTYVIKLICNHLNLLYIEVEEQFCTIRHCFFMYFEIFSKFCSNNNFLFILKCHQVHVPTLYNIRRLTR